MGGVSSHPVFPRGLPVGCPDVRAWVLGDYKGATNGRLRLLGVYEGTYFRLVNLIGDFDFWRITRVCPVACGDYEGGINRLGGHQRPCQFLQFVPLIRILLQPTQQAHRERIARIPQHPR